MFSCHSPRTAWFQAFHGQDSAHDSVMSVIGSTAVSCSQDSKVGDYIIENYYLAAYIKNGGLSADEIKLLMVVKPPSAVFKTWLHPQTLLPGYTSTVRCCST